jgi:hypothetical protein
MAANPDVVDTTKPEAIMSEAEDIKKILTEAGYTVFDINGPLEPLTPIAEAIKAAPTHWP